MSVKSKGINVDKIIKQFEKMDWDEQYKAYLKLKEYMQQKATEQSEQHQEKVNYFEVVKEKL